MLACMTGLRRRVETVNLDQGSSVPFGFVFELTDKLTPSDIADSLSKLRIFNHVLDNQALNADHLVFVNNAPTELVLVISPSIGDTSMDASHLQTSFVPVLRSLLFLGMSPLSCSQAFLIFGKIAGITYGFSGRERDHGFDAKIKANHFVNHWQRVNLVLYQDRDEVAVSAILRDRDRTGFGILGEISMPVDIQGLIHLGKRELLSIPLERIRGIGSRLIILLFLEGRVFGSSLKEVDKSALQMTKGLLYRNRRNVREPRILFLEIRQHGSKIVVVEALSELKIGRLAGRESPIVDKADASERLSQGDPLLIGRIEPEFVCPLSFLAQGLFSFLLLLYMLLNSVDNFTVSRSLVLFGYLLEPLLLSSYRWTIGTLYILTQVKDSAS